MGVVGVAQLRRNVRNRGLRVQPQPFRGLLEPVPADHRQRRQPHVPAGQPLQCPHRYPQLPGRLVHPDQARVGLDQVLQPVGEGSVVGHRFRNPACQPLPGSRGGLLAPLFTSALHGCGDIGIQVPGVDGDGPVAEAAGI